MSDAGAAYLVTPFVAWAAAGALKFAVNSVRARRLAFDLIGYGGLPSNHTSIVTSMVALIGAHRGIADPAFGVAVTLAFIVVLDATSLRRQVGRHAEALNALRHDAPPLRDRIGHTRLEVAAGALLGAAVGWGAAALAVS